MDGDGALAKHLLTRWIALHSTPIRGLRATDFVMGKKLAYKPALGKNARLSVEQKGLCENLTILH